MVATYFLITAMAEIAQILASRACLVCVRVDPNLYRKHYLVKVVILTGLISRFIYMHQRINLQFGIFFYLRYVLFC